MDRHRGRETWWRFPIRLWKRRVSWSAKRCRWRIYISGPAVARPPIRMCDLPIRICKRWYGSDIALPSYIPPGRSRCVVNSSEEIGEPSQMLRPITWLFVSVSDLQGRCDAAPAEVWFVRVICRGRCREYHYTPHRWFSTDGTVIGTHPSTLSNVFIRFRNLYMYCIMGEIPWAV